MHCRLQPGNDERHEVCPPIGIPLICDWSMAPPGAFDGIGMDPWSAGICPAGDRSLCSIGMVMPGIASVFAATGQDALLALSLRRDD